MSDIFSVTCEELLENGIFLQSRNMMINLIDLMRYYCNEGSVFFYPQHRNMSIRLLLWNLESDDTSYDERDKKVLFKINNFNEITLEQFEEMKKAIKGLGENRISFLRKMQAYFKGENYREDEYKEFTLNKEICKLKNENNRIKYENEKLKKENELLLLEFKEYDITRKKLKTNIMKFLDKI